MNAPDYGAIAAADLHRLGYTTAHFPSGDPAGWPFLLPASVRRAMENLEANAPQVTPRERYDAGLPPRCRDERDRYAEYDACLSDADRAYAGQMRAFGVTEMAGATS